MKIEKKEKKISAACKCGGGCVSSCKCGGGCICKCGGGC